MKTKIIIFNKGGSKIRKFVFYYKNTQIEIAQSYCYLGIEFSTAGTFNLAISKLKEKANKALFSLQYFNTHGNIDLSLKLFKSLIEPIATYGSEIWAPYLLHSLNNENFMQICERSPTEQVLLKICRFILGVHRKSCTAAVKGELGTFPLLINSICAAVKYWSHLHSLGEDTLAFRSLRENYTLTQQNRLCWLKHIKLLFRKFDLQNYWENVGGVDIGLCIKKTL